MSFLSLKIAKSILKGVDELGFVTPTPIQTKAIPIILSGQDTLGIAQTGTGKTAAYALPLLTKLLKPSHKGPRALILVPTRELAKQVGEDMKRFTRFSELTSATVFGGIGLTKHIAIVEGGVDIVIATPGRLMELYSAGALELKHLRHLVIDEADRMLDMGFMPTIRKLLNIVPVKRQNLLFSATFSKRVEVLTEEFLDFPVRVEVALSGTTPEKLQQHLYEVPNYRTKLNFLLYLLIHEEAYEKVLIFCRTKEHVQSLHKVLRRKLDKEVRAVHSNKSQTQRTNAIRAFREDEADILISTDVAARGLDIDHITHIINFDIPYRHEEYIHRVGRTARAGNKGETLSMINKAEMYHMNKIIKMMHIHLPILSLPEGVEVVPTEKEEIIAMEREIDRQKRIEDPKFKGAFHEKKRKTQKNGKPAVKRKR